MAIQKMKRHIASLLRRIGLEIRTQKTRGFTRKLRQDYNNTELTGVEIGVDRGKNAKEMLEELNIEQLYLIDPYERASTGFSSAAEQEAANRLSPYKDHITWVKKTSFNAVADIPDRVDFVYIDGVHKYEYVKKELELYWPHIRSTGLIGGHDAQYQEVFTAVQTVARKQSVPPEHMGVLPNTTPSWAIDWYIKKT